MGSRSFETPSLPRLLAATHRGFAFYVGFPKRTIRPVRFPIYVARRPAASFLCCYPRSFTFCLGNPFPRFRLRLGRGSFPRTWLLWRFRGSRFIRGGCSLLFFRLGRRLLWPCIALFVLVAQVGSEFLVRNSAAEPGRGDGDRSRDFHRSFSGRQMPRTFG
jgi:hypothetical protein